MLDDFLLEIIAGIAVLSFLAAYLILKIGSAPKIETPVALKKQEKLEVAVTAPVVPPKEEISLPEAKLEVSENRRKSDTIIPKRPVPPHDKITKHHFCEFSGERIMVAEDNPINQKVIMGLLAESGIELVMANDGQEALEILENDSNFVMILMDANMPRMDGFEATRSIRANPKYDHILIVALSGDTATDDIQKMKDAGMDEQLAKPLRMDALYNILYAYTDHHAHKNRPVATEEIKMLNIERGLETCGGDEAFYREILSEFIADYADASQQLGELLRANDMQGADALLLDIIGVSENIGAHVLGESASAMKLALKDTDERNYFSLFDQYQMQFEKLLGEIRAYL